MPDEALPSAIIKTLLDDNWNIQGGLTAVPRVIDANAPATAEEYDINTQDTIYVKVDTVTETDDPIGNWTYTNRHTRVILELYTSVSRQRLYNIKQEIRRICNAATHTLTSYQRLWFQSFNELTQSQFDQWAGICNLELLNNAIIREI